MMEEPQVLSLSVESLGCHRFAPPPLHHGYIAPRGRDTHRAVIELGGFRPTVDSRLEHCVAKSVCVGLTL